MFSGEVKAKGLYGREVDRSYRVGRKLALAQGRGGESRVSPLGHLAPSCYLQPHPGCNPHCDPTPCHYSQPHPGSNLHFGLTPGHYSQPHPGSNLHFGLTPGHYSRPHPGCNPHCDPTPCHYPRPHQGSNPHFGPTPSHYSSHIQGHVHIVALPHATPRQTTRPHSVH